MYSTAGSQTSNTIDHITVTVENSTVKKLSESQKALSGLDLTFNDAAIFVGGASGNVSKLNVTTKSTVNNVALTLAGSTVEGDIYLGGYAHDKDSITTVKSSQLVLREGTSIRCHTNFRHPFNLSWSGKTCDIRRSSKTTS